MNGTKTKIKGGRYFYEVGGFKFYIQKYNSRYTATGSQWHISVPREIDILYGGYGGQTLKAAIESCDKIAAKYCGVA